MQRHIVEAKDMSTSAKQALQRMVCESSKQYPDASKMVDEIYHIDDYLDKEKSTGRAPHRLKEFMQILHLAQSKFTEFVSNAPNLANEIVDSPERIELKVIVSSKDKFLHALGLKRNHKIKTVFKF